MDVSLQSIITPINKFFSKHHLTIFITILSLMLIAALVLLITVVTTSTTPDVVDNTTNRINGSFDEATIKRVGELQDSGQNPALLSFPKNERANPFVE